MIVIDDLSSSSSSMSSTDELDFFSNTSESGESKEYEVERQLLEEVAVAWQQNNKLLNAGVQADSYLVEGKLNLEDITVEITGLGKITFPITPEYAKRLIEEASPATFGQGELTKYDQNVRDTFVIPGDKLNISINDIDSMLVSIRQKLALNENSVLKAHLHNLLIYKEGQFFDYHQDTEKIDSMVATLVISLPSPHIGGNLIIRHCGKSHTFHSEALKFDYAKYIAFYSDCYHKVEKVREGYRIVLTFILVLDRSEFQPTLSCNEELLKAVKEHFEYLSRSNESKWTPTTDGKDIPKLACLFNHSYSKQNLKIANLKGSDIYSASAFTSVARKLKMILNLALVKITETYRGGTELDDLEETETKLYSWKNVDGEPMPYRKIFIPEEQVCWLKPNQSYGEDDITTDYTGNEGVTEERFYSRAAIVLWPQSVDTRIRFLLNYNEEIVKVTSLLQTPNNESKIISIITEVQGYIHSDHNSKNNVIPQIAAYIKNSEIALKVCLYICEYIFTRDNADMFCTLRNAYGSEWCLKLLNESNITRKICSDKLMKFAAILKKCGEEEIMVQILKDQIGLCKRLNFYFNDRDLRICGIILKVAKQVQRFDFAEEILSYVISRNLSNRDLALFCKKYCKHLPENITKIIKDVLPDNFL